MADIKFLHIGKILQLAQGGQRVERQDEYFNIFESVNEAQTFDFEVRQISKLQYRWILDVKFFDVEIIFAFK